MASKLYSIIFTDTAEMDLDNIYGYIMNNLYAETAADELMAEFKAKIMQLQEFPLSCPIVSQVLPHKGYRKLIVGNYLVFYRVDEIAKTVYIARILYGSRNYIALLNE